MRCCPLRTGLILLLIPAALTAQRPASRWTLALGLARESFGGASRDTSTLSGTNVRVLPSSRLAAELGLGRRLGPWDLALAAGYASGSLRARTDALVLDDRTTPVRRYRMAIQIGRRIARLGENAVHFVGGPTLDHWTTSGLGDRTTLAARAGVALRIPLGGMELENRVLFGVGQSPFRKRDLPPEAVIESLRTWSVGVTLHFGL